MIVESIRLQNIKSYGAGPDGRGVTVPFQPGVNRIAGVNGCGKTTIVEAIGYALFFSSPVFEEKFAPETYLLAHGAKAGEIDITFNAGGESYRLERGLGPHSKRRSKVVDVADGSICAEGDEEVAAFLCALLKLPSPDRLTELFSKLVGVKQGRLAWPFDSKPKSAKDFFEPLLEVEVFRECFDRLKPVADVFRAQRTAGETRQAVLAERLRERADAGPKLEAARLDVEKQEGRLVGAAGALAKAQDERTRQEGLERTAVEALGARDRAAGDVRLAAQGREEAEKRVGESEEAVTLANASEPGYAAYGEAEKALRALEERRKTRDGLLREREAASAAAASLVARRDAAREQRDLLLAQQAEKRGRLETEAANLAALNDGLSATREAFEREQREAEAIARQTASVSAWMDALPGLTARMATLASRIAAAHEELGRWDAGEVALASEARHGCEAALNDARRAAAQTEERIKTLREQLARLADGVCPFLGERCEQFDPAKVQEDVSRLGAAFAGDQRRLEEARVAYEAADARHGRLVAEQSRLKAARERLERDLGDYAAAALDVLPGSISGALEALAASGPGIPGAPSFQPSRGPVSSEVPDLQRSVEAFGAEVARWWPGLRACLDEGTRNAALAQAGRTRKEVESRSLAAIVRSLEDEAHVLGKRADGKDAEAAQLDGDLTSRTLAVATLDARLQPFEGMDVDVAAQRKAAEAHKADYEAFLRAKPLADLLASRRDLLEGLRVREVELAAALAARDKSLEQARAAFDPANLAAAKADCEARAGEVAGADADLHHARAERDAQQRRFDEWQEAKAEAAAIAAEIARHTAGIDLTELARTTLRDAAPAVAQHLCTRIALRAQAVYNQINPDPVALAWDAERYSLFITPGDRRFAMLSGGEQTKLALAMTLAMVEEFSGLRFCIFDEPTYGVDSDSRRKLAHAILQVRDAAGLDQLLLVSHDDAFEGEVEHTVVLGKSAAGGTAVEGE